MKRIAILFLILKTQLILATDFKCVDGKVSFPVAKIDNDLAWTDAEKTELINSKTKVAIGTITAYSPAVVNITPQKFEIALSTNITGKMNRDTFLELQSKDGLFEKLRSLKTDLDLAIDLGDTQRAEKLRQQYSWLKSYYGGLTK